MLGANARRWLETVCAALNLTVSQERLLEEWAAAYLVCHDPPLPELPRLILTPPPRNKRERSGRLDAIRLLACIFFKLDDMRSFDICAKALSSLYPRNIRFYKSLQLFSTTGKREKLLAALRRMAGYERFILLDEGQNPLAPHFDESRSGAAERSYIDDLKQLLGTFYSS